MRLVMKPHISIPFDVAAARISACFKSNGNGVSGLSTLFTPFGREPIVAVIYRRFFRFAACRRRVGRGLETFVPESALVLVSYFFMPALD